MHIVPESDSTRTPPVQTTFLERMSRADGCPECLLNAEVPRTVTTIPGAHFQALYRCADCGHCWVTSWGE